MKEFKVKKRNLKKMFDVTYQDTFNNEIIIDIVTGAELWFIANNPDVMMIHIEKK